MSEFLIYLRLGVEHILDPQGYDHVLFVVALAAVYAASDWRRLLWLVTAFTAGHSATLALATLRLVPARTDVVEFLIPLTILVTSALNVARGGRHGDGARGTGTRRGDRRPEGAAGVRVRYALAFGFGLVHGLGFSTFLRAVLGAEEGLLVPLLAFNVGLEAGQACVLAAVLAASYGIVRFGGGSPRAFALVVSGATGGIALTMLIERWPG